jgi:N-acetylmuramoyl-L-alanine amidase
MAMETAPPGEFAAARRATCLVVVGHQPGAKGAKNAAQNLHEYDFNGGIADALPKQTRSCDITVDRYRNGGGNVQRWSGSSDFLLELHANAFNGTATGTEVLYRKQSSRGKLGAEILLRHLVKALRLKDRGPKPIELADRGGYLVWGVSQLALIPEPFFIDNDADLARAQSVNLAATYAAAIEEIAKTVILSP